MAQTFGNQFFKVRGNYPATDFRTPGWIHPLKAWWRDLTLYVLAHFEEDLERLGLYEAVRATCYDIRMSVANFYAIFDTAGYRDLLHPCWRIGYGSARDVRNLCSTLGVFPI